jgi:hypothetical protein
MLLCSASGCRNWAGFIEPHWVPITQGKEGYGPLYRIPRAAQQPQETRRNTGEHRKFRRSLFSREANLVNDWKWLGGVADETAYEFSAGKMAKAQEPDALIAGAAFP